MFQLQLLSEIALPSKVQETSHTYQEVLNSELTYNTHCDNTNNAFIPLLLLFGRDTRYTLHLSPHSHGPVNQVEPESNPGLTQANKPSITQVQTRVEPSSRGVEAS